MSWLLWLLILLVMGGNGVMQKSPWLCPEIEEHPRVECSCDLPHTLRCTGDKSAIQVIGRRLRSLGADRGVSLLDCTVQNVSSLGLEPLLEGVALHGLVVSSGEISHVHNAAFQGLAAPLQALGLPNNQLTSVPTSALSHLIGLDRLDLSHNKLTSIKEDSFTGLRNLSFLDLSDNALTILKPGSFRPLQLLSVLKMRGNLLGASSLSSLQGLAALHELDLSSNRIGGVLGPSTLPGLKNLKLLYMDNNDITSVKRGALAGLVNLTSLSLHHNEIDVIEDHAFRQLPNLTELDLSHNGIVAISGNSLAQLVFLVKLDLSHNFLRAVTAELVRPLQALRELRLDDNDIAIIDKNAFASTQVLDRLTLADNPLSCECSMWQFIVWLKSSVVSRDDSATAICTTPPHLEGAALVDISTSLDLCQHQDDTTMSIQESEDEIPMDDERVADEEIETDESLLREKVALAGFNYDGSLVKLRWSVEPSAFPYICDAVFVYEYEEGEDKGNLVSSEPIHCDSAGMPDPKDLSITVPGSRDLIQGHRYRYCIALLQGSRENDELTLVPGCSEIMALIIPTGQQPPKKRQNNIRVVGVRSNVTMEGSMFVEISLSGYPPDRPHNLQLDNGVDPSEEQIAEYFDLLNNCYVSLGVFAQGSLIAQRDTQCSDSVIKMEGFEQGPYRVCATLSEYLVTGPNAKCIQAQKVQVVESAALKGLSFVLVGTCGSLAIMVLAMIWGSRKLIRRPPQVQQTNHQCFVPDAEACLPDQHARYVKLQATTKV